MAKQSKLELGITEDEETTDGDDEKNGLPAKKPDGSLRETEIYSITGLTYRIKNILEYDERLNDIWVRGEISNYSTPNSGHTYFTIKDEDCSLSCVKWKGSGKKPRFDLEQGMNILAHGKIGVYTKGGTYQLQVDEIRPDGLGTLHQAYLMLKDKLEKEGLFDEGRKKSLPEFPGVIGVATSQTGAVLRDIINVISRRFPRTEIYFVPTQVQGEGATDSIINSLRILDGLREVDLIIVGRGGGSVEDLWAFNEEPVVRAIYRTSHPVISAVGHETDFTLADFVADVRASTPSVAAELAVPDKNELLSDIDSMRDQVLRGMLNLFGRYKAELEELMESHSLRRPFERVREEQQRLDEFIYRVRTGLKTTMRIKKLEYKGARDMLESLDPASVLRRGYSVTVSTETPVRIIDSINDLEGKKDIDVILSDGEMLCRIDSVNKLTDPFQHLLKLKNKKRKQ